MKLALYFFSVLNCCLFAHAMTPSGSAVELKDLSQGGLRRSVSSANLSAAERGDRGRNSRRVSRKRTPMTELEERKMQEEEREGLERRRLQRFEAGTDACFRCWNKALLTTSLVGVLLVVYFLTNAVLELDPSFQGNVTFNFNNNSYHADSPWLELLQGFDLTSNVSIGGVDVNLGDGGIDSPSPPIPPIPGI